MFSRLLPSSHKIYHGMVTMGLSKMRSSTGADIIGFVPAEGGKIKPKPMKKKRREEDGSPMWRTIGSDREFYPGPSGLSTEYIGSTPVGFFVGDPDRQASLLEARIRDAIDIGDFREVYSDADIELHETLRVDDPAAVGEGGAVADGGMQAEVVNRSWEVERPDLPDDAILDLSTDADGMRVSWTRCQDILHERVPTEEMQMQEKRGELAGAAGEDNNMRIYIYALLAVVAVVAIFLLGPSIMNGIFGSGTFSGVGGAVPTLGG